VPRLPAWPDHTEFTSANLTLLAEPPLVTIGGNAANAAYVAARCDASVTLHTNAGRDSFGDLARAWLEAAGCRMVSPAGVRRTAVNVTAADARHRRATLFYPGSPPVLPAAVRGFSHVLVCGWPHPPPAALARSLRAWRARGVRTAYDAGPLLGAIPTLAGLRPVLAALDLFLANEHEILAVARAARLEVALARLRRVFAGHIVIKLGARGAVWLPSGTNEPKPAPGRAVRVINTVGAGDTFNGALLAALDARANFPAALRFANAVAARVVRSPHGVLGLGSTSLKR
jgi:ribokinase